MGETVSSTCRLPPAGFLLLPLLLLPHLPCTVQSFDLNSFLATLRGGSQPKQCQPQCNCSTRRAEDILQDYVTRYLPSMGVHMTLDLEKEARHTITVMTSWLGNMADIQCHLMEGERMNLTDLLHTYGLSFQSLSLKCDPNASLVWDLSSFTFLNVLDISGCKVEKAEGTETMVVPYNLWVLQLEQVPAETAESLDLSTALQLLALSFTHSNLSSLPQHWPNTFLPRAMFVSFAHNNLSSYECQMHVSQLTALNLDNNSFSALPLCVLNGSRYTYHLSLRNNKLHNLKELQRNDTESTLPPTPHFASLDLAHNKLTSLQMLRKIELLAALDVSNNQINSMASDSFSQNPTLAWLDLSNNMLGYVPDGSVSDLIRMRYLNLSHNQLRTFDFDQSPVSNKLVIIDLQYNHLAYPPFADTGYVAPRQSQISAAHNPFVCDCKMHVFLQFLNMLNSSKEQNWFGLSFWDSYQFDPSMSQPYTDTEELTCSQPSALKGVRLSSLSFKKACPLLRGCPNSCRCELIKEGMEHVSVDCSQAKSLTDLPTDLPLIPGTPVALFLNHSGLKRLEHRPYLRFVSELYAGNSKLSSVTSGAIQALQNVSVLELHNNQLRSLPAVMQNLTLLEATNISLSGNPWTCGCHDLWMPKWLAKHAAVLDDPENVICRWTGSPVLKLTSSDLNCGIFNYLPLVIALSMLLGLATILASLLIKFRLEVLVFLYTRFRIRPFDMYKYDQNHNYLFDVFVSFSQHDYRWVVEKLVDQLENRARPYKLCIHLRDFPIGAPIADSVSWAVENSRCTLLVLTRDFLASEWCRHEFRAAHAHLLKDRNAKLLIVVHGPLDARILDRELLAYLRTHTYLRTEDKWFWSKLEYALPDPQNAIVMVAGVRDGENEIAPAIEVDNFLPIAMAAGDVTLKNSGNAHQSVQLSV